MEKDVIVNKINGSLKMKNISLVDGGFITNYGGCVAIGYNAGNKDYLLSVSTEDMQTFLDLINSRWIPVNERLPEEEINPVTSDYYEYECTADWGYGRTDIRYYKFGEGHWWHGGGCVDNYVTAWCERPKPYKKLVN